MIIGIDLDNTIVDYRKSFWKTGLLTGILNEKNSVLFCKNNASFPSKVEIKNYLLSIENGEDLWETLQGQVYGKYIENASIYPGVVNFILHCKRRGVKIYIISHKTEFGHNDTTKTPLRSSALDFLDRRNLISNFSGIESDDIFFFNNRIDKVKKIGDLRCNYFIDDLPIVFFQKSFPTNTKKILFDINSKKMNSWKAINDFFFGEIKNADIKYYIQLHTENNVKIVKKIKGGGNSNVYKIKLDNNMEFAGKLYPDPTFDDRGRIENEVKAYNYLNCNNINLVPKVIWSNNDLNFGLFEWVEGHQIKEVKNNYIINAAEFVESLEKLSQKAIYFDFQLASAACLSGKMIEDQIRKRYEHIYKFSLNNNELNSFLKGDFSKIFEEILLSSKKIWPGDFSGKLSKKYQLLSPSDFGFHNSIFSENKLKFIDFEYFGWDDPVKLTSDFLLHPGMKLNSDYQKLWLAKMLKVFSKDKNFEKRLKASYRLYGLCWCLIILNVFLSSNKIEKRTNRLLESKKLLDYLYNLNRDELLNE